MSNRCSVTFLELLEETLTEQLSRVMGKLGLTQELVTNV